MVIQINQVFHGYTDIIMYFLVDLQKYLPFLRYASFLHRQIRFVNL